MAEPSQRPATEKYVKPEAAITVFELLVMGGLSSETCWEIKKHWNNKFYYTVASYWYFLWVLYCDARIHEHHGNISFSKQRNLNSWFFTERVETVALHRIRSLWPNYYVHLGYNNNNNSNNNNNNNTLLPLLHSRVAGSQRSVCFSLTEHFHSSAKNILTIRHVLSITAFYIRTYRERQRLAL